MKLEHIKISSKILLAIGVIAFVTIAGCLYAGQEMLGINTAYSSLIEHDEQVVVANIRASNRVSNYARAIYSLATETTDAGNERGKAEIKKLLAELAEKEASVKAEAPNRIAEIDKSYGPVHDAISVCNPVAEFAANSSSRDDIMTAALRMKTECEPKIVMAQTALTALSGTLITAASKKTEELTDTTNSIRITVLVANGLGLVMGIALMLWIVRSGITGPLARLAGVMESLAGGNLAVDIPGIARKDEVGQMARTVGVFKTNGLEVERLRQDQERQKEQAALEQKRALNQMADDFEARVMDVVRVVASSSTELQATAQSMSSGAQQTSAQATVVATASDRASANVQTVASATEELAASITEISRQVAQAAQISTTASEEANRTNQMVEGLSRAGDKIGEVVNLINDIASQTNLLALNATIEAARAGDAGKGFAVVAGEVKHLANQTGKATEEIALQIASVQEETHKTVEAIRSIGAIINQVRQISSGIASAVEEQGAATQEIARNVQEAAQGTQEVSNNIAGVTQAAGETGAAADQVLTSAEDLARNSERLRTEVDSFLRSVRAA